MLKNKNSIKNTLSVFTYVYCCRILFFSPLIPLFLSAGIETSKNEKIHVKTDTNFVETFIVISPKKIKLKDNLTYFWYKSRSINSTKGGFAGNLLNGNFDKFDLNKNLIEHGTFKYGLKTGEWKTWFENGELKSSTTYKKGLKHGKEIIYNNLGQIVSEHRYCKDEITF